MPTPHLASIGHPLVGDPQKTRGHWRADWPTTRFPNHHSPSEHEPWCTWPASEASRPFRESSRGSLSDHRFLLWCFSNCSMPNIQYFQGTVHLKRNLQTHPSAREKNTWRTTTVVNIKSELSTRTEPRN